MSGKRKRPEPDIERKPEGLYTERDAIRGVLVACRVHKVAPAHRLVLLSLLSRRDAAGEVAARLVPTEADTGLDRGVVCEAFLALRKLGWLVPFKKHDAAGSHDWYRFTIPVLHAAAGQLPPAPRPDEQHLPEERP